MLSGCCSCPKVDQKLEDDYNSLARSWNEQAALVNEKDAYINKLQFEIMILLQTREPKDEN